MPLKEKVEFGSARQMIHEDDAFMKPETTAKLLRIDLACGQNKRPEFKGMDRASIEGVDIVHDLFSFPWPLNDNSVYEFNCEHFVEHIPHHMPQFMGKDGLVLFMEEVHRCLQPLGTIRIVAPYYTSIRAHQDPTHCRYITERTFLYFHKSTQKSMQVDHYMSEGNSLVDFETLSIRYHVNDEWSKKSEEARSWAMKHYWNVIDDIEMVLRKKG